MTVLQQLGDRGGPVELVVTLRHIIVIAEVRRTRAGGGLSRIAGRTAAPTVTLSSAERLGS
jgi:hypothetical protein